MKVQILLLVSLACVLGAAAEDVPATNAEKVCEPGTEFTRECNVCKCNTEGTDAACEKKACPATRPTQAVPEPAAEEKCTPGEVFKVKCNECRCTESGLKAQAACTAIACSDE